MLIYINKKIKLLHFFFEIYSICNDLFLKNDLTNK